MLTNVFVPDIIGTTNQRSVRVEKEIAIESRLGVEKGSELIIGSCFFNMGKSKVIAYVSAPRPITGKNISFEKGCLECEVSFSAHLKFDESRVYDARNFVDGSEVIGNRLASAVVDAINPAIRFESYPKCVITVSILVLESSYQDLAAVINATSLALCDAAVEMKDLVTAYPVYIQTPVSTTNTDTTEEDVDVLFTVACMSNTKEITYLDSVGERNPLFLLQLIESGKEQCGKVRDILRQELIQASATSMG
jgi:ribonuclease PH